MNIATWRILKKLQSIYNIMIVRDDMDERIFIVDYYSEPTGQISNLFLKGKEITYIISDNSLSLSLTQDNLHASSNERQLLSTRMEEIPVMSYRFSTHYRYEIWESF